MTSNAGKEIRDSRSAGFLNENQSEDRRIVEELKKEFSEEFINRIDEIILFDPIDTETLAHIAKENLDILAKRLMNVGVSLEYGKNVTAYLAKKSYIPGFGVRPLLRSIVTEIKNPIAEMLSTETLTSKTTVLIEVLGENLKISPKRICSVADKR